MPNSEREGLNGGVKTAILAQIDLYIPNQKRSCRTKLLIVAPKRTLKQISQHRPSDRHIGQLPAVEFKTLCLIWRRSSFILNN